MNRLTLTFGAACLSLSAVASEAAVIFSFEETGGGVAGTLSGSLDLADALGGSGGTSSLGISPINASVFKFTSGGSTDFYGVSGPASFGTGTFTLADLGSGSDFAIQNGEGLFLPLGYTSGSSLTGTLSFTGATFASLGITPGDYIYSLPNDTITLRFGSATGTVIPLPATLSLLMGALGLAAALVRQRPDRQSQQTPSPIPLEMPRG